MVGCAVADRVNVRLEAFFRWLGRRVGRSPWTFIVCSISVALAATSGVARVEMETDYFTLWYPQRSQGMRDW
jgi:hypothetical protein